MYVCIHISIYLFIYIYRMLTYAGIFGFCISELVYVYIQLYPYWLLCVYIQLYPRLCVYTYSITPLGFCIYIYAEVYT
jgi:hypothetical protein